jgi:diguanylate cyclase (GGDEF)-like protein
MMTVVGCLVYEHNLWLVVAALVVCAVNSWGVMQLFARARARTRLQKTVWYFLATILAGSAIWSTHFIALLAYKAAVPISFDPGLTVISLLVAMIGAACGFALAATGWSRFAPIVGGAVFGLSLAATHYTGMIAYRMQGIVTLDWHYVAASIVLAVTIAACAFHFATRPSARQGGTTGFGLLVLTIVTLHFTGMTAIRVEPMLIAGNYSNPAAFQMLGFAVAGVALIIGCAGLASYLIDDGVRAESYEQLQQMAKSDSLTGLPNRRAFNERLDHEIYLAQEGQGKVAFLGIDLDRFKEINDIRGHAAGDEVLKALAQRMIAALREGEFVARLGGDEFGAIHRMGSQADLIDFLGRLENALFMPLSMGDYDAACGASIGVAIYPDNAADKETLIGNADLAMYRAKAELSRSVCFYEPSMDEAVRARRNLTSELRKAAEGNQLDIHYQVQTSISSGTVQGYEALVRWKHPQRGFIPPSEFIPLAEESDLILQIGEWVLKTACTEAASWEQPYRVAINISAMQLAHSDLPRLVLETLLQSGLPPERLELELTESTIFADKERSIHLLRQIKALGVNIALDDFGTGYSSLDTLRSFPFDKIKLDRSFITEVETNPQSKAIIRAVLALGNSLQIPVLAEGIETEGQLSLLGVEGCDEAQGYLLGRPAPLSQIIASGQITSVSRDRSKQLDKTVLRQNNTEKDIPGAVVAAKA